ncbi:MAG: hypothetical protein R8K50_06580 [Mariprofundus sp.]
MRKLGMISIVLLLLSGCSTLGIPWPLSDQDKQTQANNISMAQAENDRLSAQAAALRGALAAKKARLESIRAGTAQ